MSDRLYQLLCVSQVRRARLRTVDVACLLRCWRPAPRIPIALRTTVAISNRNLRPVHPMHESCASTSRLIWYPGTIIKAAVS